jgi:hypothetical protein
MTLPSAGSQISFGAVDTELSFSATAQISMSDMRTLAGVPSGAISMYDLGGKSNWTSETLYAGTWTESGGTYSGSISGTPPSGTFTAVGTSSDAIYTGTSLGSKTRTWGSSTITVSWSAGEAWSGENETGDAFTESHIYLEYSTDGGSGWSTIDSLVDTVGGDYEWGSGSTTTGSLGAFSGGLANVQFRIRLKRGPKIGTLGTLGTCNITITNFKIVGVP